MKFDAHTALLAQHRTSLYCLPLFQVVALAALMVGCGADEKCPQGSISEEGQCFLLESADFQVDIPDLESVQDAQLVDQLDAVDGGTSLDDATNVVAPDSLPETTGWERVNRGPLWPQRVEFLSTETTEYGPDVLCQSRRERSWRTILT